MPDHTNTHNKEKLSNLFKMLSTRSEQKEISEGLQQSKQLKKRISQKAGLEAVAKKIREPTKKHKGKRTKRKRTSVDGSKPHSHLYSKGDTHTSSTNGHKHKISKDNKRALAGKTGHSHKLKNPY